MATNSPTHLGLLPNTDEGVERIINACALWIVAEQIGLLRTIEYGPDGEAAGFASTADLSNVNDSAASSQTLLVANASRKGFIIYNDSTAILYVKFGATASTTSFTYRLTPNAVLEMLNGVIYTGLVTGIWASDASGAARITELSA